MDLCKAAANKGNKQTARAYDADVLDTRAHISVNVTTPQLDEIPDELGSASSESVSSQSYNSDEGSKGASGGKTYYQYDSDIEDF